MRCCQTSPAVSDDRPTNSSNQTARPARRRKARAGTRPDARIEPLERRALLTAAITVLSPTGARVADGSTVTLAPTPQAGGEILEVPFTLRNDGNQTLNIGIPSNTGDFTFISPARPSLSPGENTTLLLGVDLTNAGTHSSTISFATNDPLRNPFDFVVTENVTASPSTPGSPAPPAPTTGVGFTVLTGSTTLTNGQTAPVDFGTAVQGQPGPTRTFTVTNQGPTLISFGNVTVPAGFTVTDPLVSTLAPGVSDTLAVRLNTTTTGTRSGSISIPSNVPGQNPFAFPVTGTVTSLASQVAVQVNGQTVTSGQTTPVDFGTAAQGQPGPSQTFLVTNLGATQLTLGTPIVPAGFTLTDPLVTTLAPGAADTFSVQLSTTTTGTRSGTITFATNAPGQNPFRIPVTGTVVANAPRIAISQGGAPLVSGQTPVDFGTAAQGQAGPTRTFTVTNQGIQPLTLGTPALPAGFTLTDPLVSTLAPNTSDTFAVTLDTSTLGTRSGTISVPSNDPTQNPFNIPVTGTVATPAPAVTLQVNGQTVTSGQSTPVSFGTAVLNQAGPTRTFTVTNSGTSPLSLGALSLPAGFTLTRALAGTSLAPGAADSFDVQLNTSALGTRTGTISLATNAPNQNPFLIPVSGTVVSAAPAVTVQSGGTTLLSGRSVVDFGTVLLNQAGPTRTFTVTNPGTAPLTLGPVTLPTGFSLLDPLVSTLAPGAADSFTVQMSSSPLGGKGGLIAFTTTDPNQPTFQIPVVGSVVSSTPRPPGQGLSVLVGSANVTSGHTTVRFGRVPRSRHGGALRRFRVTNHSHSNVSLQPPQLPTGFQLVEPLAPSLAPGASDTFSVRMSATTPGPKLGLLQISSSDPTDPALFIPLSGQVRRPPTPFSHHLIQDPTP